MQKFKLSPLHCCPPLSCIISYPPQPHIWLSDLKVLQNLCKEQLTSQQTSTATRENLFPWKPFRSPPLPFFLVFNVKAVPKKQKGPVNDLINSRLSKNCAIHSIQTARKHIYVLYIIDIFQFPILKIHIYIFNGLSG